MATRIWILALSAIVVLVAPATARPAAAQSSPEESMTEIVSGVAYRRISVGCSRVELEFSGRLMSRPPDSRKRPLLKANYSADNGWDVPTTGPIPTSGDGTFRINLPVWNHVYPGRHEGESRASPGRSRVTISATGCTSRTVEVTPKWRVKILVLKCPGDPVFAP